MIDENIINQLVPLERGTDDLGETATFEAFNLTKTWVPRDTDLGLYGSSVVVESQIYSVDVDDHLVQINVENGVFTVSGEYGLNTFNQISYDYKDIETNEIFQDSVWPPTDPRVKHMYRFNQDPRESREVTFTVDFIVRFNASGILPLPTSNSTIYVDGSDVYRRDRVKYVHFVRNYSFKRLASELKIYIDGIE